MEYIIIFFLICVVSYYRNEKNDLEKHLNDANDKLKKVNDADRYYREKMQEADSYYKNKIEETEEYCNRKYTKCKEHIFFVTTIINSKIKDFPLLADFFAKMNETMDVEKAHQLEIKSRPAKKAAESVRKIAQEKRVLMRQNLALEWEMKYIRRLLPWIDEIEDNPMEPVNQSSDYYNKNYNIEGSNKDDIDNAGYWLTPQEYQTLTNIQKYQLALDRYNKRHKSNWEIGRDYERYIGYLFEQKGFKVEYTGIENGFNDLGRDLICTKDQLIYVVQCKCWSNARSKHIHEKYINQLYGTAVKYRLDKQRDKMIKGRVDLGNIDLLEWLDEGDYLVIPTFYSTVPYTETAKEFANALSISILVQLMPFGGGYPMIKCNINSKGEKIYHLPFDQMYDKTMISKLGEFYAMTVSEAESKGFRRAKRWLGN